ncbi:restriction endonuclease subunit S [Corynebacterium striatum]
MPRLGLLSTPQSGSGFPPRMQGQTSKELPFYKVGSLSIVGEDGTIDDSRNTISVEQAHELKASIIPSGSILLAKIGAALLLGRFVQTKFDCCIDNNMLALIPQKGVDPKYLYYATCLIDVTNLENPGPVPTLDIKGLTQVRIPLPPLPTERAIADYLDRETAEIDGMRADLDEMERLLEERRVSIIQRHVLPENGTYTRIKLVADVSLGKTVQKTQKDSSEVLRNYVRAAHIQPHGRLILDDQPMWFTSNELKQLTLEAGDVLVVEGGAGYGRSVYLREGLPGWGFQNHVIRVRPLAGASGRFIDYTIRAHYGAGLIDILADGATIPGLSSDKARELPILNVSYAEQRRIADEIDRETAEIDSMLEDITKLRDLLAERRAAVISAAVTGQIDIPASLDDKDEPHA